MSEVCHIPIKDFKPCGRKVYKDKKRCIFHLENKSDEEAKIFETEFWKELERMEKDDDIRDLDFTRFIFPGQIDFNRNFEKPIYFSAAQFNNETYFGSARFNKVASFRGAHFNDVASFAGTYFKNQTDNETDFSRAQFNEAIFEDAQFNNETKFYGAHFNKADFYHAQFNNTATFENSEFRGVASFILTKFPSNGEDLVSFKNVKFHIPKEIRFQNINLSNVSFLNTDITEVEFLDVELRKIPLFKKLKLVGSRLAVIDETRIGKDATYGSVAQLYRRLRRNYETDYRFAEAGEFFIGEMEMRRLDVNANIKNEKMRNIVLWLEKNISPLAFYKYLSLYGESYRLPLLWILVVVLSYPMLMQWLFNITSFAEIIRLIYDYLRTSVASFFQMDDTYLLERIIGILLLGLLFISLKRKFERKK